MGWEPTTVYEHDEAGRVVSSTPEVEWDETEQAWMLALKQYENSLCPLCGGPLSECTDIENELKFRATPPLRCHRTTQRQIMAENFKSDKTRHPGALLFGVELRD